VEEKGSRRRKRSFRNLEANWSVGGFLGIRLNGGEWAAPARRGTKDEEKQKKKKRSSTLEGVQGGINGPK